MAHHIGQPRLRHLAFGACIIVGQWASTIHAQDVAMVNASWADDGSAQLRNDRYPALYTNDYGDCLGGESLFNVTKYDAAYYADNQTVVFHLDGTTNVRQEDLIMHISIYAYGESRFNMTFDPCEANITSLCPLKADTPITAFARFPVEHWAPNDISSINLGIPDFDGSAQLRIFANSSQTEIGCFQAVVENGASFSHPYAISAALGGFTALAVLASFVTAIYGVSIPHIRTHHGHAFSVMVIFEVLQTVYFSGSLSLNWPSVLPAWWSNFAWSAGLIYSETMVDSLAGFAGISGNASQVGGAGSAVINPNGGLVRTIYGRSTEGFALAQINRRAHAAYDPSNPWDYSWAGNPVALGLPMPGTWPGFAGTLSLSNIPHAGAFLIGLIWSLVALGLVVVSVIFAKLILDVLVKLKWASKDGFSYFRSHLPGYLAVAVLRALLVAFFPLITLALFQFNIRAPAGPIAVAAVTFVLLLVGMGGLAAYACFYRLRLGKVATSSDQIVLEEGRLFKVIPFVSATRASRLAGKESTTKKYGTLPFYRVYFVDDDPNRVSVHKDEGYMTRFGWLTAHYRRTRWWFFALWLIYTLVRACFLGGGARNPLAQVFGLFIVEIIAFVVFVKLGPFEGQRNGIVAIWMLGICKVVTAGFSIAFLPEFAIGHIAATVIGIIIIVVQAFVVLAVMVLVILGIVSSWMSVHRNREEFKPEGLDQIRISYYEHLQNQAPDLPPPIKTIADNRASTFNVRTVRRERKIEDDDVDDTQGLDDLDDKMVIPLPPINRPSRTNSVSSRYSVGSLPRRARPHRASWSSKDFAEWDSQFERPESSTTPTGVRTSQHVRHRSNSLRQLAHLNSQSSLRINPDLLQERPDASAEGRRPPLTPAHEIHEEEAVSPRRPESGSGRGEVDENGVSPVRETFDTEPFPSITEQDESKH